MSTLSSITNTATHGLQQASRWHVWNRAEKNQAAATDALDQISLSQELGPKFTEDLSHLRSMGDGMSSKGKLTVDQRLLASLSRHATSFATQGIHSSLAILEDVLADCRAYGDDSAQLSKSGDRVFQELVSGTADPVLKTASMIEEGNPMGKIYFAKNFYLDSEEYGADAADYLKSSNEQDRPIIHSFLIDQLKPMRTDQEGQKALQLLATLTELPADDDGWNNSAVESAFVAFAGNGTAKDLAETVRSFGLSKETESKLQELEGRLQPQLELDFTSRPPSQLELAL